MCHEAYLSKAESSRRIDHSKKHKFRPPKITKMGKRNIFENFGMDQNINARFSVSNDIDETLFLNILKSVLQENIENDKIKLVEHKKESSSNSFVFQTLYEFSWRKPG